MVPESAGQAAEEALRGCLDTARAVAAREKVGQAQCPRCHKCQPWMVWNAVLAGLGVGGLSGLLGGVAAAYVYAMYRSGWTGVADAALQHGLLYMAIPAMVVCAALGLAGGMGKLAGKAGAPEPSAKTDEEWSGWLDTCMAEGTDPVCAWYRQAAGEAESLVVSLGVQDQVGDREGVSPIPKELTTKKALTRNLAQFVRELRAGKRPDAAESHMKIS